MRRQNSKIGKYAILLAILVGLAITGPQTLTTMPNSLNDKSYYFKGGYSLGVAGTHFAATFIDGTDTVLSLRGIGSTSNSGTTNIIYKDMTTPFEQLQGGTRTNSDKCPHIAAVHLEGNDHVFFGCNNNGTGQNKAIVLRYLLSGGDPLATPSVNYAILQNPNGSTLLQKVKSLTMKHPTAGAVVTIDSKLAYFNHWDSSGVLNTQLYITGLTSQQQLTVSPEYIAFTNFNENQVAMSFITQAGNYRVGLFSFYSKKKVMDAIHFLYTSTVFKWKIDIFSHSSITGKRVIIVGKVNSGSIFKAYRWNPLDGQLD